MINIVMTFKHKKNFLGIFKFNFKFKEFQEAQTLLDVPRFTRAKSYLKNPVCDRFKSSRGRWPCWDHDVITHTTKFQCFFKGRQ